MKRMKHTICSMFTTLALAACITTVPNANALTYKSGADCNAANLSQALLGISMSQAGIVNNSAQPLFVVCSVDVEIIALAVADVAIEVVFPAAPLPGTVTPGAIACTYRLAPALMTGFGSVAVPLTAGLDSITPAAIDPLRGLNSIATVVGAPIPPAALLLGFNQTFVCALDPGEGISAVIAG